MAKRAMITVDAPPGLIVDYDPYVSVQYSRTGAGPSPLPPPDPDDPYVVYLREPTDLSATEVRQRASETVRTAAARRGQLTIYIERANILSREALDLMRDLGEESGTTEIAVYVERRG